MDGLPSSIMHSLSECPICLEDFSDPRTLPCLHTLCHKCLGDHVAYAGQKEEFTCPICRKSFPIPSEGADAFPINFFVNSYMAVVRDRGAGARSKTPVGVSGEGRNVCSNSEDGDDCAHPQQYCLVCNEYYCKACSKAHRKSKISRSHEQVALADLTEEMMRQSKSKSEAPRCSKHKKKLKLYCSSCKCTVCTTCCVISHQSHRIMEISDIDVEVTSELWEIMAVIQGLVEDANNTYGEVDKVQKTLRSNSSSAIASTHDVFNKLNQIMEKKSREIEQNIDRMCQDVQMQTDVWMKNMTLNSQLFGSMYSFVEDLVVKGSAYDRLACLQEVRSRLQQLEGSDDLLDGVTGVDVPSHRELTLRHLDGLTLKEEININLSGRLVLEVQLICDIKDRKTHETASRRVELKEDPQTVRPKKLRGQRNPLEYTILETPPNLQNESEQPLSDNIKPDEVALLLEEAARINRNAVERVEGQDGQVFSTKKVEEMVIEPSSSTVEPLKKLRTVEILGLKPTITTKLLRRYFAKKKKSGGGPIVDVEVDHSGSNLAWITFCCSEDADDVVQRGPHYLGGTFLKVRHIAVCL